MTFALLAVICTAGLFGPLLALSQRWRVPVVVGELIAGIVLGPMVLGKLSSTEPTFTFLADVGFALVMFVAGSHVPVRDPTLRRALPGGVAWAVLVGLVSVPVGYGIARGPRADVPPRVGGRRTAATRPPSAPAGPGAGVLFLPAAPDRQLPEGAWTG